MALNSRSVGIILFLVTSGISLEGIATDALNKSVYNVLIDEEVGFSDILSKTKFGFDIAPSNIDLAGAEIELKQLLASKQVLKRKLLEASEKSAVLNLEKGETISKLGVVVRFERQVDRKGVLLGYKYEPSLASFKGVPRDYDTIFLFLPDLEFSLVKENVWRDAEGFEVFGAVQTPFLTGAWKEVYIKFVRFQGRTLNLSVKPVQLKDGSFISTISFMKTISFLGEGNWYVDSTSSTNGKFLIYYLLIGCSGGCLVTVIVNLFLNEIGYKATLGHVIVRSHEWRFLTRSGKPGGYAGPASRSEVYERYHGRGSWARRVRRNELLIFLLRVATWIVFIWLSLSYLNSHAGKAVTSPILVMVGIVLGIMNLVLTLLIAVKVRPGGRISMYGLLIALILLLAIIVVSMV